VSWACSAERALQCLRIDRTQLSLSADGSCSRRAGHPLAASSSEELSQKIEFVFSASPETIRGSLGSVISFAQSANSGTWQPAYRTILMFFIPQAAFYAAAVRLRSSADTKSRCCRSTASKYATILRATASVARLRFPFCISLS